VADQHHGPPRRARLDHPLEVAAELVDGAVLHLAAAAAPVAALVPEDEPPEVGEVTPLVVPARHLQRVAVTEDDGERGVGRPDLLDVELDAVVGGHPVHPVGRQRAEGLARHRVGPRPGSADRASLGRDTTGEPRGHRAADRIHDRQSTQQAHAVPLLAAPPTYTRGTRLPTRVTTS